MKKYFTFGLIMSLVSGACFAEHPMIAQLIREKQQKMEKLEKCKGTTKNLKIAGISTLGITAVGVGANIAEAVVLDKAKTATKKAEKDFKAEEKKKTDREAAEKARQDKCDAWNGSLSGNTCEISGFIKGSKSDVDSAINNYTSSTCSNIKRTDLSSEHKSKIEATCDGINVVAYVNMPVEKAEPKAETSAPAAAAAQNQNGAKQADAKPGDKTAQTPADKKQENQTPAEKPEEVAAKKSDEDFMNACKKMGYRSSDKNSGELSCFYEVKTPTKKQDMESVAGRQVRGVIADLCKGNTLRDDGDYFAIYCGKGTLDHRLYITFKNIVEATPEAPAEETPEAPAEETPEAPAEATPEAPAEETPEAPAEETPEAPAEETPEAPAEETPEAPAEETPEAPAEATPEAPAEETPEDKAAEAKTQEECEKLSDEGYYWNDIDKECQMGH